MRFITCYFSILLAFTLCSPGALAADKALATLSQGLLSRDYNEIRQTAEDIENLSPAPTKELLAAAAAALDKLIKNPAAAEPAAELQNYRMAFSALMHMLNKVAPRQEVIVQKLIARGDLLFPIDALSEHDDAYKVLQYLTDYIAFDQNQLNPALASAKPTTRVKAAILLARAEALDAEEYKIGISSLVNKWSHAPLASLYGIQTLAKTLAQTASAKDAKTTPATLGAYHLLKRDLLDLAQLTQNPEARLYKDRERLNLFVWSLAFVGKHDPRTIGHLQQIYSQTRGRMALGDATAINALHYAKGEAPYIESEADKIVKILVKSVMSGGLERNEAFNSFNETYYRDFYFKNFLQLDPSRRKKYLESLFYHGGYPIAQTLVSMLGQNGMDYFTLLESIPLCMRFRGLTPEQYNQLQIP